MTQTVAMLFTGLVSVGFLNDADGTRMSASQHSLRPQPQARCASREGRRGASPHLAPSQNRLLAALPLEDFGRLLPHLEPVPLPAGATVYGPGDRHRHLYFVTAGIVSRLHVMRDGASAEFAVTGREGVVGIASFLGGDSMPARALVLSPGYAYRLAAAALTREFDRGGALALILLRYTEALITQMAQTVVCNRHHSLHQQLCRWILLCLDRLPSNEIAMTQELIADMLGVRREGVTEAAGRLQKAGLIHYSRGHIAVIDRPGLEAQVCECYAVVNREYDRLLRPARIAGSAGRARHAAPNGWLNIPPPPALT